MYWNDVIIPQLKEGQHALIAVHGNSLRGIVKLLDGLSAKPIMSLILPAGTLVYELHENYRKVASVLGC